jgi:error-prone DNA polymerase
MVICRQRPGTAKGVLFMTLEDETGLVNLVVWQKVLEKYELLAKTQSFLGVTGKLQIESGVVHLVVEEMWQPQVERGPTTAKSRDFH